MTTTLDRPGRHDDVLELLFTRADTARDAQPLDADVASDRARRLMDAADRGSVRLGSAPARPTDLASRRRPQSRRWALLGVAAAAAAAALVVPPMLSEHAVPTAAADQLLNQAAIHATDPTATAGQYWRITETGTGDFRNASGSWVTGGRFTLATYEPVTTGTTWYDRTYGSDRHDVFAVRYQSASGTVIDPPGTWQDPTPAWLEALPRDTTALRQRLYRDAGTSGSSPDAEVFVLVSDALKTGEVPADVRSGLYRVLATVPGISVSSQSTTIDGRTGVGFTRTEPGSGASDARATTQLVIDPATGEFIGYTDSATRYSTAVTRTVVDAVPASVQKAAQLRVCTAQGDCTVVGK